MYAILFLCLGILPLFNRFEQKILSFFCHIPMSTRSSTSAPNAGSAAKQSPFGWGGGSKKQGLVHSNFRFYNIVRHIKTKANGTPEGRSTIHFGNMLGGIGRSQSQFGVPGLYKADGVKRFQSYVFRFNR